LSKWPRYLGVYPHIGAQATILRETPAQKGRAA